MKNPASNVLTAKCTRKNTLLGCDLYTCRCQKCTITGLTNFYKVSLADGLSPGGKEQRRCENFIQEKSTVVMLKILLPNFHYRQRLTKVCQGGERKGKTAVKGLAIS